MTKLSGMFKRVTLGAARSAGLYGLAADSAWRQRRLAILCYHGISLLDEHEWDPLVFHSRSLFRRRLEMLRAGKYNVVPLAEGLSRLASGTLPRRSVAITFDDGLYDFSAVAAPLLQEFGYPATVYVTTYYAQRPWPVFPPWCRYVLWCARARWIDLSEVVGDGPRIRLDKCESREEAARQIMQHCSQRGLDGAGREALARRLESHLGVDGASLRERRILQLMTPEEIAAVSSAGFDVQLHTHRHRTPDDAELFEDEIQHNRSLLQQWVGAPVDHFAYPSGVHRPSYPGWLRSLGIKSAVTSESGLASDRSDPLLLPRVMDQEHLETAEFEAWLCGVRALVPSRVNVVAIP